MKWRGENNRQITRDFMRELDLVDRDIVWLGWVVEHTTEYDPEWLPHQERCTGRVILDNRLGFFVSFDCSDTSWIPPEKLVVDWNDRGNAGRLLSLVEKVYGAPVVPLPSPEHKGQWLPFAVSADGTEVIQGSKPSPTRIDCLTETLLSWLAVA